MKRNKVFMNDPPPRDESERTMIEMLDRSIGVRPLDGTNLAWIYNRKEESEQAADSKKGSSK